jgi:cytochrome P450
LTVDLRSVPRAPGRLPLIGHVLSLWRRPLPFLKELRETGELVRVDLGTMPVYFVTTPELTHELLVDKARSFVKGRFFDRARILLGDGLANVNGTVHRRHRRLMQPAFHHARIVGYTEIMGKRARAMVDSWKPGGTIEVDKELIDFSVSTLAEALFSSDITPSALESVKRNVPILLKTAMIRTASPSSLDRLPLPVNRQFDGAAAGLRKVINDAIAERSGLPESEQKDLMSMLLAARDADTGETLTHKEVQDEAVTILFAGTETTASTIAWAIHEVARHPEVEKRLMEEVDSVVGDRPVGFEDVAKLEYTRRVFDEAARLHALPLLMRRTTEPVELAGFRIPADTEIGFSLYAMHQSPQVYSQPHRFDPDRWLPGHGSERSRKDFIPFGSGNRQCIGNAFAQTEAVVTLATVASRWKLRPVPGQTIKEVASAVAHPDQLPMTVVARGA